MCPSYTRPRAHATKKRPRGRPVSVDWLVRIADLRVRLRYVLPEALVDTEAFRLAQQEALVLETGLQLPVHPTAKQTRASYIKISRLVDKALGLYR